MRTASTRSFTAWLCLAVVLLRAVFVFQPLRADEGGYLLIARQWHLDGEHLYGDYYVDRPPLLLLIFRLAALFESDAVIRVIVIPFALLFVVAATAAAHLIAGHVAAKWSAVVAAALVCSPALAAEQADGELFAIPLVMASVALILAAWRSGSGVGRFWLAAGAGALAATAPWIKQSFIDALVFAAVMIIAELLRRGPTRERLTPLFAGTVLGALVPTIVLAGWVHASGIGVGRLWSDLAGIRWTAMDVIWSNSPDATIERGLTLVVLAVVSGMLPVLLTYLASAERSLLRSTPATWALGITLSYGVAAILLGGSYWPHYLLQLAPMTVLAVGAVAPGVRASAHWMRRWAWTAVVTALAGCVVTGTVYLTADSVWRYPRTGEWLARSSSPGDSAFVAYGHGAVLEYADLPSPYPHLWSLPMRVLDPRQEQLRATLRGRDAPTWIVQWNHLNSWDIDTAGRLRDLVTVRYRMVEQVCGHRVWLRRDLSRPLAPPPDC